MRQMLALFTALAVLCISGGCNPVPKNREEAQGGKKAAEQLPAGYIRGMDLSSVVSLENSGVMFYSASGQPQDVFVTLAEAGVNYIRVRVWNNPYDIRGNGYGGGNCDVQKAAEIGRRAAQNGMRLLVDFHYSDFWADPERQLVPKAWAALDFEQKKAALFDYTVASLNEIWAAGADIGMVQIGNEINNGIAGESELNRVAQLLQCAASAVRKASAEKGADVKVAVHYTDVEDYDGMMYRAESLAAYGTDYDVFGVSYYPYWHGSLENLTKVLSDIGKKYGKSTVVLETAYPYTLADGDGFANVVGSVETNDYPVSVQGQHDCIRDIMWAAKKGGALGVFCWESAWIPVGSDANTNRALWEACGSGWASSFSEEYDPDNAGKYYGGCSWENQAFFDFKGHPLDSLRVFGE